jgi:hypothetical protein
MSPKLKDNVSRTKSPSPLGITLFIGLRCADLYWQYTLLTDLRPRLLSHLGPFIPPIALLSPSRILNLAPAAQLILLMAAGSTLKQNLTLVYISEQEMPVSNGIVIPLFNTIFNTANSLLLLHSVARTP